MDQQNALQAAKGAMQSMPQQGAAPMPAQAPTPGLPVPPPHVAIQLAQMAQTLDPMVLGTLIWRALKQHGESLNAQGMNDLGQGGMPQMGGMQ